MLAILRAHCTAAKQRKTSPLACCANRILYLRDGQE